MTSSFIQTPGTLRPLVRLSLPVLAEQVLHLCVGFADLALTGHCLPGDAYVASMTLVVYLLWLIGMLFAFVGAGATPVTARLSGAGDTAGANRAMNQSIVLGAVWAAALMAIGLPTIHPFVTAMGLDGPSADAAARYLTIELWFLPAIMVERVGVACLRGAGDTVSGLGVMAVVNAVNIAVSWALVTGAGGWAPELGWDGVAIGTAAGHATGAAILLALLIGGRAGYRLRLAEMRPDPAMMRRLLRIGIPGGFESLLLVVCNLAYLRLVLRLGDVAAAAHGVAIQVEALAYMPGGAFQIAASTMAGQYLGAGEPKRATRSVLVACAAAATLMVGAGLLFWFAAEPLIALYIGDKPEVAPLAAKLLRIISLAMLPLAIGMVLSGALRGAGDTRWPLAITLLSFCTVRIPLAAYLAYDAVPLPYVGEVAGLGWGAAGAWTAAAIELGTRALLFTARFAQGGWRRVRV
ncbi:MAG: MATE family efflux transporter [Planctomycetota bacterium]